MVKKTYDNLDLVFLRGGDSIVGYGSGLHAFWFAFNRQNEECKFYLPTGGRGEIFIDGRHYPLEKGKWFLIGAGEKRSYYTVGDNQMTNRVAHFCTNVDDLKKAVDLPDCIELDSEEYDHALKLMKKIKISDKTSPAELAEFFDNKHKIHEIFSYYVELAEKKGLHREEKRSATDDIRLMLFDYINSLGFEHMNIGVMSEKFGVNAKYFPVYFKKLFFTTPQDMIYKRRFDAAMWDLTYGGDSVKTIAENCGFKSVSHFCRIFKKYMGMTPSEYKETLVRARKHTKEKTK